MNILGLLYGHRTISISVTSTLNSAIVAQKQSQTISKAQATKGKINNWDYIKLLPDSNKMQQKTNYSDNITNGIGEIICNSFI